MIYTVLFFMACFQSSFLRNADGVSVHVLNFHPKNNLKSKVWTNKNGKAIAPLPVFIIFLRCPRLFIILLLKRN